MASLYCAPSKKKTSELRKLTRIVLMIMMSMIVGVQHPFGNFFLAIEDRLEFFVLSMIDSLDMITTEPDQL